MITSIDEWIAFLRDTHYAGGVPLVAGGIGLMLFGWRMWKLSVVISFALIGAALASRFIGTEPGQWIYALVGAAVLGLVSYRPANLAIGLLGGLISTWIVYYYLKGLHVDGLALWVALAVVLVGGTAYSILNRRHVVVGITALFGAVLLMSGLTTWVMEMPGLFATFNSMASGSAIVVPFLLLVPTVVSCFYQVAEMHRLQIEV